LKSYNVKYRAPGKFFWTKIRKVIGDYVVNCIGVKDSAPIPIPPKWCFDLEDQTKIEIPVHYEVKFGKERFYLIKRAIENETGRSI